GGTVRSGGVPIPGVAVTATQGSEKVATSTDESGHYTLGALKDGTWQIEVSLFGFAPQQKAVPVTGQPMQADWTLEMRAAPERPGNRAAGFQDMSLLQTAETSSEAMPAAPEPETTADANQSFLVSGTISREAANPQQGDFGREFGFDPRNQAFGAPEPGGMGPGGFGRGGGGGRGGPGGGGPRGPRGRGPYGGGRFANFGNRANRRGAQGIHGQMFYSIGNSALNAKPYSITGQNFAEPSYGSHRFGLNLGGPLVLPKYIHSPNTFFFLNYIGTRQRSPYSAVATVPTLLERSGVFSQSMAQISGVSRPVSIFDPTTGLPFAGNVLPPNRLNPAAVGLLRFIPLPNQPGLVNNYQVQSANPNNADNLNLRVNRTMSKNDRVDGGLSYQNRDTRNEQVFGFRDATSGSGVNASVGWSHTLPAQTVNSLRLTYSHNTSNTLPFFAYGENVAAELGIAGTSPDPINFGPPNVSFTNFGALSDGTPALIRNQTVSVTEGLSLTRKNHALSFGGEFRRRQLNSRTDSDARGSLSFSGLESSAFGANGQPLPGTGYDFADYLLGLAQSSSVRFGDTSTYFRQSQINGFFTDNWRARPDLTFNLGLRVEHFEPLTEKYNRMANLDIAPDFSRAVPVTPGQTGPFHGKLPDGLVKTHWAYLSPRVGVAWRPMGKRNSIVRAGYSLFYNGSIYDRFASRLAAQPPFAETANLVGTLAHPLLLEDSFLGATPGLVTNTYAVDPDYQVGYAQTWTASLQQTLRQQWVLEAMYLGTKGTHLDTQRIPNRSVAGSYRAQNGQTANASIYTYDSSEGNSIYHSLQLRVMRRMAKGLSLNVSYRFAKSIDNASTLGGGAMVVAQNDRDLRAERGLSSFDQRHVLGANFIAESPFGENGLIRSGPRTQKLLANWTLSGGANLASGTPLTARVLGNQSNVAGTGAVGSGRADATGQPLYIGSGFFNPLAFTVPAPGNFGNAGRNTIITPAVFTLNLALSRSVQLGAETRRRLEFRVESNNLLNSVNVTSFGTTVNASNYGQALAVGGMRTITGVLRLRF
ncbi:MAG TPA: hypothetical protein DEQ47_12170, partial [Solibacterales bacterium]|nr:hypothetical protein [Bryobacterales bacterium]